MSKKQTQLSREYSADIERYLNNKIPELPKAACQEIGEYIVHKTNNFMLDWMAEYERIQTARMKRRYRGRTSSEEDHDEADE